MLLQIKTICTTIHTVVPLVQIVGAITTLIEPITPELINLGRVFQRRRYKTRPIVLELSQDTELEKFLHSKTQNANESFNGTLWEHIPKKPFVTLPNLGCSPCDAVAHFNGMKVSVLIFEKHNFAPGVYMLKDCGKRNLKRVNLVNQQAFPKNRLRQQILRAKKMSKNDKLLEKEGNLYIPRGF